MSARSFRSVGWVAGVGAAALGCYMLSLQVAAERAELSGIESRIVRAQQAIRDLQTELGTRGRLSQLEHWNAEVLALSAPVAGQFVENEVVLARLETPAGELGGGAQVRMASAETASAAPAAPAAPAAAPQPQVRTAVAVAPAVTAAVPAQPVVRQASLAAAPAKPQARPPVTRAGAEPPPPAARAAPARPAPTRTAAPVRATALLDERTARQIGEAARAESRARRPARAETAAPAAQRSAAPRAASPAADGD